MEVFGDRDGRSAGHRNFAAARLGDARRTAALVATVDRVLAHPPGTLPRKLGDPAALARAYRLLRHPMVTHASVLAPHRDHTRRRMAAEPVVLVIHDTTELDYDRRAALAAGLGRIGNGSRRGLLCHNSLAVTPGGRVLGLLNQVLHARRDVPAGEPRAAKRAHPGRESRLWPRGVAGCGDAPPGCLVVDVADRGADTAEFVHGLAGAGRHFVIRSAKDRRLAGDDHVGADRVCRALHAYARQLPALGWRTVRVHANRGGRDARGGGRDARVSVAAGPVTLAAPPRGARARGECPPGAGPLDLWVACVREVGVPPAGAAPVEWVLLSDLPMRDLAEACVRVDWYARRPAVEELHRAMKEGLGVEALRLGARDRLDPAIAILSAAAAILLDLRRAWADPAADHVAARASVPAAWVDVLAAVRGLGGDVSLRRFALELAKLGGYLPRRRGRPGWQTLWRGWDRLNAMLEAVEATKLKRSG